MVKNVIKVVDRIYISGIKKYPKSTYLRLFYAFFLLEQFNNKQKSLEQLMIAETQNPNFQQQFLIFRFKYSSNPGRSSWRTSRSSRAATTSSTSSPTRTTSPSARST